MNLKRFTKPTPATGTYLTSIAPSTGHHDLRARIARIVQHMTSDFHLRQDLEQEALFHIWLMEIQRPYETMSWYLQSCRFHLRNYLRNDPSIDSPARAHLRQPTEDDDTAVRPDYLREEETVVSSVCARDILSCLLPRLDSANRDILLLAAHEWSTRQIASEVGLSQIAVVKRMKTIALTARRLFLRH
jgi:DNA-directed RNA polymerase specialized sigma24 family protein